MRVVLDAEGPGELGRAPAVRAAPGQALREEELGPGHVLVRRALSVVRGMPPAAVRFEASLRPVRRLEGSALHVESRLRRALAWPLASQRPELHVVLVDENGEERRYARLVAAAARALVPHAIGVARREFEAWLVADQVALSACLGRQIQMTSDPESMGRGEAKELLSRLVAESAAGGEAGSRRIEIAARADLEVLARRCPSFQRFLDDLKP